LRSEALTSSFWRPSGARRSLTHGSSRRKIPGRISAAKRAATDHRVWLAQIGGELFALGERYWRAELGVEQQAVLREEPREQQPVPLLVRALRDEQVMVVAQ